MSVCKVEGCEQTVSKAGHTFCIDHWRDEKDGKVKRCTGCQRWHDAAGALCRACEHSPAWDDDAPAGMFSSTRIGKHFGLSSIKTNLILAELGWIEKYVKGWVPTDRGNALGANRSSDSTRRAGRSCLHRQHLYGCRAVGSQRARVPAG